MSERDSTIGPFAIGIAVGAALALLFAPEAGDDVRGELGRRFRSLRDLALEKVEELTGLVAEAAAEPEPARAPAPPARRLATAASRAPSKRRRKARRSPTDA